MIEKKQKKIALLGSTGSIGTQSLEVCKDRGFAVTALAANRNVKLLEQQAREFLPQLVCIYDESLYTDMKAVLADTNIKVVSGMEGLLEAAAGTDADTTLNSVVGMIGLRPTLAAIAAGKDIALANKETLVTGGKLVAKAVQEKGVHLYPVDSEHSAIFQCLQGNDCRQVKKIILTASGGPFFGMTREQLKDKTAADALKHPNWDMGAKITIDSASLMNKGLEFIEAAWLFDKTADEIDIVVQRESVIHSAVEYVDHAVIAQLGVPDMKIPIQYALTYPERYPCSCEALSLFDYPQLHFARADEETFTCLKACKESFRRGGVAPTYVNGANEAAVALFLQDKIKFLQIGDLVNLALEQAKKIEHPTLQDILDADKAARELVYQAVR